MNPVTDDFIRDPMARVLNAQDMRQGLCKPKRSGTTGEFVFTEVNLSGLGLTDISLLSEYRHLEVINLSQNKLTSGAINVLYTLPNLVSLDLSYNMLETFGRPIYSLTSKAEEEAQRQGPQKLINSLKIMNLSNNRLHEEPDMTYFPFVRKLNLSHNALSTIQKMIGQLIYLKKLNVSHNFLSSIPETPELTNLDISHNKVEMLVIPAGLKRLDVSNNSISRIASADPYSSLISVDLSDNPLFGVTAVASAFRCCKALRSITMKGVKVLRDEQPDMLEEELDAIALAKDNSYEPPVIACQSLPTVEQLDRMRDKAKSLAHKDSNIARCAIIAELPQVKCVDGVDVTVDDILESIEWCHPDIISNLTKKSIFH